jgi:hypothetical protein
MVRCLSRTCMEIQHQGCDKGPRATACVEFNAGTAYVLAVEDMYWDTLSYSRTRPCLAALHIPISYGHVRSPRQYTVMAYLEGSVCLANFVCWALVNAPSFDAG